MNRKYRMILSEALLIWAFGCAAIHEDTAAVLISLSVFALTVYTYGPEAILKHGISGLLAADLCLVLSSLTGLSALIPSSGFVIAVNSFYAVMTLCESWHLMDESVKRMGILLLVYTALSFLTPGGQMNFVQTLVFVMMIFGPVPSVYAIRVLCDQPQGKYHSRHTANELE